MSHSFTKSKPYNNGCPSGYHKREGYKSSTGLYIPTRCVRSTTVYKESSKEMKRRVQAKMTRRVAHVPSIRSLTRKDCPPGKVMRKGYVRRYSTPVRKEGITVHKSGKTYKVFPKAKSTIVKAGCIKEVGKGRGKSKARFGTLRKGELTRLGYSARNPDEKRHAALKKAVQLYRALGVYRKLDAVAKLSAQSLPSASVIYAKDRDWIRTTFGPLTAF